MSRSLTPGTRTPVSNPASAKPSQSILWVTPLNLSGHAHDCVAPRCFRERKLCPKSGCDAERRARAHAAAMLFDVEGGSAKAMSALRRCATVSEMYQIRFEDTRTSEDFLRETMQRGKKRRVRR